MESLEKQPWGILFKLLRCKYLEWFLKKAVEKGKRLKKDTLSVFTKCQQMFGQWNPFLP